MPTQSSVRLGVAQIIECLLLGYPLLGQVEQGSNHPRDLPSGPIVLPDWADKSNLSL
jgi:hypothetical protein